MIWHNTNNGTWINTRVFLNKHTSYNVWIGILSRDFCWRWDSNPRTIDCESEALPRLCLDLGSFVLLFALFSSSSLDMFCDDIALSSCRAHVGRLLFPFPINVAWWLLYAFNCGRWSFYPSAYFNHEKANTFHPEVLNQDDVTKNLKGSCIPGLRWLNLRDRYSFKVSPEGSCKNST